MKVAPYQRGQHVKVLPLLLKKICLLNSDSGVQ